MKIKQLFWLLYSLYMYPLMDCISTNYITLILPFIKSSMVYEVNVFICSQQKVLKVSELLSEQGVRSIVHSIDKHPNLSKLLFADTNGIAIIIDIVCPESQSIIEQASKQNLLSSLHHWLLLGDDNSTIDDDINIPLNSHVVLATEQKYNSSTAIILQDVYKLSRTWPLIYTPARVWLPGRSFPPSPSRDDFQGLMLKAGVVVFEDDWNHRQDLQYKHLDTWSKVSYGPMVYVSEMLNFSMNETFVDSWGYTKYDGVFTGLVGLLQKGECDIGAVQCLLTTTRLDVIDYTVETLPFRPRFLFRQPPLSSVTNIYTLPFSVAVWTAYGITVAVIVIFLFAIQRIRIRNEPHKDDFETSSDWSETLLNSVGIICQQGSPNTPNDISSRITFQSQLLLSLFFFTSYSAIIVSLLQTPSTAINNLNELLKSPLKITMHDIIINHNYNNYINESLFPLVKELFHERILNKPKKDVFLTQEHGLELIRTQMFAFHVDVSAFKIIGDTWQETEKCNLKEIYMYPESTAGFPIKKGSPYKEHFARRLRWLREVGIFDREWKRIITRKPKCENNDSAFISVGFQEFYPALLALMYGVPCSLLLMLLEIIHHKKSVKYSTNIMSE